MFSMRWAVAYFFASACVSSSLESLTSVEINDQGHISQQPGAHPGSALHSSMNMPGSILESPSVMHSDIRREGDNLSLSLSTKTPRTAAQVVAAAFVATVVFGLLVFFCIVNNRGRKYFSLLAGMGCSCCLGQSRDDQGKGMPFMSKGKDKGKGKGKFNMNEGATLLQHHGSSGAHQPMWGKGEAQTAAPPPQQHWESEEGWQQQQKGAQISGQKAMGKGEPKGKLQGKAGKGVTAPTAALQGQAAKGSAAPTAAVQPPAAEPYVEPSAVAVSKEAAAPVVPDVRTRAPTEKMKIALTCEVINGTGMPSVNTFGGCDPFVEVRCVTGDPVARLKAGGNIDEVPRDSARTTTKDGDLTPDWNETLTLAKAIYGKDKFVNIVLFDSNISKNTPLGYHAINTTKLLEGMTYDPKSIEPVKKDYQAKNLVSLLADQSMGLNSVINLKFSYVETHKFKIKVKGAGHLPKVDTLGSIDAFVEARLVTGDPGQMEFNNSPGQETKCSAKTKVITDNMDPNFNETLEFEFAADPRLNLVVSVSDSGALGNTPIGFVVVPLMMICSDAEGVPHDFNKCKLKKIPNWPAAPNLAKATVSFSVSHEVAYG